MNIADWIAYWARATPDKAALHFEGRTFSYREFDETVRRSARMLRNELGIAPGDRVAYLGQNHAQALAFVFACARLGAIFVPLNWRLAPPEHRHMLRDCGAAVLIVDAPYYAQCEPLRSELPDCLCVALGEGAGAAWPKLGDLLANAQGEDQHPAIGIDRPLLIVYTSGTTGFPKGAVLTQEAVQVNALNSVLLHGMTAEDRILSMLPLFHVGGLNIQTTTAFYVGATVILQRSFEPQKVLDALIEERPTLTIFLPAQMPALRALPGWEQAQFRLRAVLTGSCSIPDDMVRYWHGRGIPLLNMYGATETAPIAIHQSLGNAAATAGTVGFPAMHCEARVVDPAGLDCPAGVAGEILVRGRNVMAGYWNNPAASAAVLDDGWLRTGDIGVADEHGCYRIIDRKKNMIISGGENIYPAELENVLAGHPDILEAAVVGRPDPQWGEVPVAVVVTRENHSLDKREVLAWFDGKLGRYKHPKDVLFVDALPRNEMRKVVSHVLRDMVAR
jgi:fatty-acyl-CoA synthase